MATLGRIMDFQASRPSSRKATLLSAPIIKGWAAVAGTNTLSRHHRPGTSSIRAAGSMKASGAGNKAIVYGWSQGGGATIAAASLPDYIARQGTASDNIQ